MTSRRAQFCEIDIKSDREKMIYLSEKARFYVTLFLKMDHWKKKFHPKPEISGFDRKENFLLALWAVFFEIDIKSAQHWLNIGRFQYQKKRGFTSIHCF
jgi:hypothetical protein